MKDRRRFLRWCRLFPWLPNIEKKSFDETFLKWIRGIELQGQNPKDLPVA